MAISRCESFVYITPFVYLTLMFCFTPCTLRSFTNKDLKMYRDKVAQMFHHAYDSYLENAFPFDELQPLSCSGIDTWGSFSLTLIDSLDTLAVMGNYSEFQRVVGVLVSTADFDININVSVFETNIRVVGGLISAHLLSRKAGIEVEPGWPCSGPLLHLAENVARRLLPAFKTNTGMPYGTVNLRHGVPIGETPVTCTAGVSTFIVEFGTLSRLTGDPIFEKTAMKALNAVWERRSPIGLVGNHINIQEGKWTAMDAGIGGGIDSYYEYLVKGAILFQEPKLMKMFKEYYKAITKYMKKDDWYFWVSMSSGQVTLPIFQSLDAYWPGLLSLVGETEQAQKTLHNYHKVWKQYGFTPEFYDVPHNLVKREGYPLRPELIESVMYLYRATKDPQLLEIGVDILESIQHSAKTDCGYATIKNVLDHQIEDRMESFFLAETTKYLYLLFDPGNFIHNNGSCGAVISTTGGDCILESGGYIFNTEAHPIDIGAVYCCSSERKVHQALLQNFQNTMDLYALLGINEKRDFLRVFKQNKKKKMKTFRNLGKLGEMTDYFKENECMKNSGLEKSNCFKGVTKSDEDLSGYHKVNLQDLSTKSRIFELQSTMQIHDTSGYLLNFDNTLIATGLLHDALNVSNLVTDFCLEATDGTILDASAVVSSTTVPIFPNTPLVQRIVREINTDILHPNVPFKFTESHVPSSPSTSSDDPSPLSAEKTLLAQNSNSINSDSVIIGTISKSIPVVSINGEVNRDSDIVLETLEDYHEEEEKDSYELLSCPAQPFAARLSIMGHVFNTE